jgi:oxygen-independent coproporphyrinogen-3 oxidase
VDTVFFGGGTPSLMPAETVDAVMTAIRGVWEVADDAEVSLEANPTSVEARRFEAFRDAGVNRLSMGLQALDDSDLQALGRLHTTSEAKRAFTVARSIFSRVSFDLIYARQGQSVGAWEDELGQALEMAVDHLSLYQLTIEPETRFGTLAARGKLRGLPDDAVSADLYCSTQKLCCAAGLPAYEVSNHAVYGAQSRHNLIYWRYGDYVGIGPGAHGRISIDGQRLATETHLHPETWLSAVEQKGSGISLRSAIRGEDQATEMLLMGLRLSEGINLQRYELLAGRALDQEVLRELQELRMITVSNGRLCTTDEGRLLLNKVIEKLTDDSSSRSGSGRARQVPQGSRSGSAPLQTAARYGDRLKPLVSSSR